MDLTGRRLAALLLPLLLLGLQQEERLHYRAYDPGTDSTLWRFSVGGVRRPDGGADVSWRSESGDGHRQQYRVGPDGGALEWTVLFPERDTDYRGVRRGDSVMVRGRLLGDEVDRSFEMDGSPLLVNVAVGLAPFVMSGRERMDFWVFRPDDISVLLMEARLEGLDTLDVQGQRVPAVRVRWAPRGWRGRFFSRRFWFRPSDGALLHTDIRSSVATVLTSPPEGR